MKSGITLLVLLGSVLGVISKAVTDGKDNTSGLATNPPNDLTLPSSTTESIGAFLQDNDAPKDLKPPTGPVLAYSNSILLENEDAPLFPQGQADEEVGESFSSNLGTIGYREVGPSGSFGNNEEMEPAESITIGRHSGRFFGPGIWLGGPLPFNRPSHRYRPRPSFFYRRPHYHHRGWY